MSAKILRDKLRALPGVVNLVEHYLESHAPETLTLEPVTVPRVIFDVLCMVALVGLESLEE